MAPGRNEPCPCGSGRKFKQCCGATGASDAATPTGADREAAWNLLDRVSCLPRFQDDVECGFTLIWGEDWQSPETAGVMNSPIGDLFFLRACAKARVTVAQISRARISGGGISHAFDWPAIR